MAGPQYTFWLRDLNYNRIEPLDIWTNLSIVMRFNRVGTWNLELPASAKVAKRITPTTGIIIQRDGETIFSGPSGYNEEAYIKTKNTLSISGADDNVLLETPARPTPSLNNGPYPDDYDVRTGLASDIMCSLVSVNIGPHAPSAWQVAGLNIQFPSPAIGAVITARARFDPLITLLAELASTPIATGLGFKIQQPSNLQIGSNTVVFQIYVPRDKSLETKFSTDLHTAQDFEHKHQVPSANYFMVGGGDAFGAQRTVVEGGDATSIAAVGRRIATFVDRRGVVSPGELNQELAELIAGAVTTDTITITPADVPALRFGDDYDLGDLVTAVVDGVPYARIIREIEITFDPEKGPLIKPVVADPLGTNDEILSRHMFTLQDRISNIERNFNVPNNSIIGDMIHDTQRTYVGDMKYTARSSAQPGWLICNGSAISRGLYTALFAAIGTKYGVGDGSTSFNIPDLRDRSPIGAGPSHAEGSSGGSESFSVPAHSHLHSHGLNNHTHLITPLPHTHPGSHSHGIGSHQHTMQHQHNTDLTHDHGTFESGRETNFGSDAVGRTAAATTGTGHRHNVDAPPLGTTIATSSPSSNDNTGSVSLSTDPDSNAHNASFSSPQQSGIPSINTTEPDSTISGSVTVPTIPPFQASNWEIYTGVVP